MRVFKYDFSEVFRMPIGAKILRIAYQDSKFGSGIKLWAEVDPDADQEIRKFAIVPTGQSVPAKGKYITSYETLNGLMFHIYDIS